MAKRKLIAELIEGFDALAAARKGKRTLRTTEVKLKPAVEVTWVRFGSTKGSIDQNAPSLCQGDQK